MRRLPKKAAPFVWFVNLYAANSKGEHSISTVIYTSRARAIRKAQPRRIATLKVTTTVEVV